MEKEASPPSLAVIDFRSKQPEWTGNPLQRALQQQERHSDNFLHTSNSYQFYLCNELQGPKNEPKHFFLKLFGRFRDIPAKSRDIPQKKFDSLGFEGHTELFGPHPFKWKTPALPENIRTQKFRFGFLFSRLRVAADDMKGSRTRCMYVMI